MKYATMIAVMLFVGLFAGEARADLKSKAATEAVEFALARFGRGAVKEAAPTLIRRAEMLAAAHGDDVLNAVRKVGPSALNMVETGGAKAAGVLARHGERGATLVLKDARGFAQFLKHGEHAAEALVRHPGTAAGMIEKAGLPAAKALSAVGTQSGRRLAILLEGEMARHPEVLEVVAKWGEAGAKFVWDHKAVLASSAVMAVFIADPEPFITGVKDIATAAAESVPKAVGQVAAAAAESIPKAVSNVAVAAVTGAPPERDEPSGEPAKRRPEGIGGFLKRLVMFVLLAATLLTGLALFVGTRFAAPITGWCRKWLQGWGILPVPAAEIVPDDAKPTPAVRPEIPKQ